MNFRPLIMINFKNSRTIASLSYMCRLVQKSILQNGRNDSYDYN